MTKLKKIAIKRRRRWRKKHETKLELENKEKNSLSVPLEITIENHVPNDIYFFLLSNAIVVVAIFYFHSFIQTSTYHVNCFKCHAPLFFCFVVHISLERSWCDWIRTYIKIYVINWLVNIFQELSIPIEPLLTRDTHQKINKYGMANRGSRTK